MPRAIRLFAPPKGPTKNSYCPRAASPIAPQERSQSDWGDNDWKSKSKRQKLEKEGTKGNGLMKGEYCRRYQRGSRTHGGACHYNHGRDGAKLVDEMETKYNAMPSVADLRNGRVPGKLKKLAYGIRRDRVTTANPEVKNAV